MYDSHLFAWPVMPLGSPVLEQLIVGDVDQYGPRGTGDYSFPTFDDIPLKYSKGTTIESWDVTPDRIVFTVRPGVLWAAYGKEHVMEVRPVTAEDIAWSMFRFIDEGAAEGAPGWLWTENGGFIDSVSAVGDTVVVETSRVDVRWKHWIAAGWGCLFYPPEVFEQDLSDWMNLVGTGPFMVKEHVLDSYLAFERNPTYWDKAIINGKEYEIPFVDELIYAIIPDESTQIAALRTGKLDLNWGVSTMYKDTLAQTSPELIKFYRDAKPNVMAFNFHTEYFKDLDVRRALTMAVDREAVLSAVWGPGGDYNTFPVGEDYPDAHTPFDELPLSVQEYLTYDPVEAARLLDLAGYPAPDRFTVTLLIDAGDLPFGDAGAMVAAYWAAVDVELILKTVEGPAYTAMTYMMPIADRIGDYDCVILGDATHLAPLAGLSNSWHPAEVSNLANYDDEYFGAEFDRALTILDEAERDAILKEIAVYAMEACAYLPFGSPPELCYWWPWVKNYYGEKTDGCITMGALWSRMWIDQALKTEMGY